MKKVLIVTYYWPPSGGIGVNRCLKFAKYLRKFGWEPVIYTAKNPNYPFIDEENLKQVPEGITVIKRPIIEPFSAFKFLSGRKKDDAMSNPIHVRRKKSKFIDDISIWIRGNFFIPDARSLWVKPSVKFLLKYLKENPVDAILSDGPPHTNTLIACRVSEKANIPWLMDFQDPWTQVDYYNLFKLTRWADRKHRKLEQESFIQARKTTIASPSWKKDLESIGAKNVDAIFWGYDEEDFEELRKKQDEKFTISHAGILGYDRCPDTFFKILNDLKSEIKGFTEDMQLNLAGMVDYSIFKSVKENDLENNLNHLGTISRKEALSLVLNSRLLLLPINKAENAKGRIPGKLFELLRTGNTILYLGIRNSDVENIINKTGRGKCFEYDDYDGIKTFLIEKYKEYKKGITKDYTFDISKYSVENQTKRIAGYLDEIITENGA